MNRNRTILLLALSSTVALLGCSSQQEQEDINLTYTQNTTLVERYQRFEECSDNSGCLPEGGFHVEESYRFYGNPNEFEGSGARGLTYYSASAEEKAKTLALR